MKSRQRKLFVLYSRFYQSCSCIKNHSRRPHANRNEFVYVNLCIKYKVNLNFAGTRCVWWECFHFHDEIKMWSKKSWIIRWYTLEITIANGVNHSGHCVYCLDFCPSANSKSVCICWTYAIVRAWRKSGFSFIFVMFGNRFIYARWKGENNNEQYTNSYGNATARPNCVRHNERRATMAISAIRIECIGETCTLLSNYHNSRSVYSVSNRLSLFLQFRHWSVS